MLRWVSKAEETKIKVDPPPPRGTYSYAYPYSPNSLGASVSTSYGQMSYPYSGASFYQPQANTPAPVTQAQLSDTQPSQNSPMYLPYPHPPPPPTERIENVSKNYVVHELGQYETVPLPPWHDTMEAMFGDHVNWEELRVYVGKGRPLGAPLSALWVFYLPTYTLASPGRPKQTCLLTGLPARYLDPRTGVPYANAKAYQILTRILAHRYIWSESLGCYIGAEDSIHAQGLSGSYQRAPSTDSVDAMDVQ